MPTALVIASAALLGASFNIPMLWPASLFAFVPLLLSLDKARSLRDAFRTSIIFSLTLCGLAFYVFFRTLPLDWLAEESIRFAPLAVFLAWVFATVTLALPMSLAGVLYVKFRRGRERDPFMFGALWVLCEYLRTWVYAIIMVHNDSLFGPHFSYGFVGYDLAWHPLLLQLSRVGGVYALSLAALLANACVYLVITRMHASALRRHAVSFLFVIVVVALSFVPVVRRNTGAPVRVALVQTMILPSVERKGESASDAFNTRKDLIRSIRFSGERPLVVVLPEDARLVRNLKETSNTTFLSTVLDGAPLVIDSGRVTENGKTFARTTYVQSDGTELTRDKRFLAFGGEYVPSIFRGILHAAGFSGLIDMMDTARLFDKGGELAVGSILSVRAGALLCSETMSTELYREYVREHDVNLLVSQSSLAWFHGSTAAESQNIAFLKVHAASLNRYLVQAGNGSPSVILDRSGNVRSILEAGETGVLYGNVHTSGTRTLYGRLGGNGAIAIIAVLFGALLWRGRRKDSAHAVE